MRDSFIGRLHTLAGANKDIVLITGDLGFKVLDQYRDDFPSQFINAGIAEQNMTGIAVGLALSGKACFTYSIGNFPTLRCLEQIRNDACYHDANVKIVSVGGGFSYGALGISHHATEDIAIMRSLPNITVVAPCGIWEAAEATEALVSHDGVAYLRLDKGYGDDKPEDGPPFELGKARWLRRGSDLTFVVCGGILSEVQEAAHQLHTQGVEAGILSMHTIKPLDTQALSEAMASAPALVTVEEHSLTAGLGGAVAEALLDMGQTPKQFMRVGLDSCFSSIVGSQQYLRQRYQMDASSIVKKVVGLLDTSQ